MLASAAGYGFALARIPTESDARNAGQAAHVESLAQESQRADQAARERGPRDGLKAGRQAGRRAGRKAGARRAGRVLAETATPAAPASSRGPDTAPGTSPSGSGCPPGEQMLTRMGTTYCGRPEAARPQDCPPGEVPVVKPALVPGSRAKTNRRAM